MKTYKQLKAEHQAEMNKFEGIFFAFNVEQFYAKLQEMNCSEADVTRLFAGGFILKSRVKAYLAMTDRQKKEMSALKKDTKALKDALTYELNNHEYCYTCDVKPALDALNLKKEDVPTAVLNAAIKATYKEAC